MFALASICCYAAGAGVASHLGYFIHGEHHEESAIIFGLFAFANVILFGIQVRFLEPDITLSLFRTLAIAVSYLTALWTSMTVYRLFFHRLRSFPGPLPAKVSKLWHSYQAIPKLDSFRWLARLHEEYGDVVRTGTYLGSIWWSRLIAYKFLRSKWALFFWSCCCAHYFGPQMLQSTVLRCHPSTGLNANHSG